MRRRCLSPKLCYTFSMRLLIYAIPLVALLLPAPEAEACSCARSGVEAWPKTDSVAPTNAHVFVRFPDGNKEKVILRLAGTKDTDGVPAARIDVESMDVRFVELAPTISLAPGAKFEVVVGKGDKARVISTFAVGKKADESAPKRAAVKKATFTYEESVCCTCGSDAPFVTVEMAGAKDEEKRRIYGIWTGTPGKKMDWNRKPDAYVLSWYGSLTLGDASICSPNTYPIPRSEKMTFGVREVSQSGKQGAGEVVTVKVKTEKTKARIFRPMGAD